MDADVSMEELNAFLRSNGLLEESRKPGTLLEELEKRLEKWRDVELDAHSVGNSVKAKRIGRVCDRYEDAIKACKANKPYEYETLAVPGGYPPLPLPSRPTLKLPVNQIPESARPTKPGASPVQPRQEKSDPIVANQPVINYVSPSVPSVATRKPPVKTPSPNVPSSSTVTTKSSDPKIPAKRTSSIKQKEISYLLERQKLFREAALNSKRKGDIKQAAEYLRQSKGFDPLIEAARKGLTIDTSSIPTPPQLSDEFVLVPREKIDDNQHEHIEMDSSEEEIYRKLEIDLQNQIEMCKKNKDHFLALGDVSSSSKFEKYAINTAKDLDMLRNFWRKKDPVPRFRYETRNLSIVSCNTHVGSNELIVEIPKAIELPSKNKIDSYVRVEFPFPTDNHQFFKTKTIKDSLNPVYEDRFTFNIDRKSRSFGRMIKRCALKCEIFSKGGFFRSDSLVGAVPVKLCDLESKVTIHNCFSLMDGRKLIGGKLEVKIMIREPIVAKQVEEMEYKWLTLI